MKFSILIANYNNGKFFRDCYESILRQTYNNWEAVILDDGSIDNSLEVIKEIIKNDTRFRFFENEKNEGVGFTKGKLIELADGEICGYLDPDDALLPNALKSSVEMFQKKKTAVLTYSRMMHCDENLNPLSPFKSAMQVPNGDKNWFNCPVQIAHFVCFKKAAYETCEKMNSALRIAEDQDLYLKMYEKGDVYFIDETNYLYRGHSGGISQNQNKQKAHEYFAQAIFMAMKRRKLDKINGKKIPETYTNSQEIFNLLEYQNNISYRLIKKMKIWLEK